MKRNYAPNRFCNSRFNAYRKSSVEDIDLHWRINMYLFSDLMLEICQAKHLICKKKNELDFPLIADQRSRETIFHITVCSYPKGGTFTTKLDLKN
jgi:hypothetical protein